MIVGVNDFVRRQVKGSGKTYAKTMRFSEIAKHAEVQMLKNNFITGYRDGVRRVIAHKNILDDFVCPYVKIVKDTKLVSKMVKRSENEEPYIQIRALNGTPLSVGKVELILYRNHLKNIEGNVLNIDCKMLVDYFFKSKRKKNKNS